MNRLEEIRERLAARTPGEWLPSRGHDGWDIEANSGPVTMDSGMKGADAIFIVHAPTDLAALLAVAEAAAEYVERWTRPTPGNPASFAALANALAPLTEEENRG